MTNSKYAHLSTSEITTLLELYTRLVGKNSDDEFTTTLVDSLQAELWRRQHAGHLYQKPKDLWTLCVDNGPDYLV